MLLKDDGIAEDDAKLDASEDEASEEAYGGKALVEIGADVLLLSLPLAGLEPSTSSPSGFSPSSISTSGRPVVDVFSTNDEDVVSSSGCAVLLEEAAFTWMLDVLDGITVDSVFGELEDAAV